MIYIILFLLSFGLTYFIKEYAIKKSLVAAVNERSSHSVPTPHGGGIAVSLTWFIGLSYLYMNDQIDPTLFYALIIGAVIAVVGLVDDIIELKAIPRMVVFTLVGASGLYIIGGLDTITFGLFDISNPIITSIIAMLLILWYINLTNFIDGIDSYLAMKFIFLSVAGLILFGADYFVVLGVSVLGFLYWNWHKAKIFMGDVGSTLLGYTIAIITIYYANIEASNLWIWVTLYGVFWFDATITLIRRKLNGEKLTQAHRKHAYQRLTQSGWSHSKVTLYATLLNLVIFAFVYFIPNVAVSFALSLVLLYGAYRFVEAKKKFE
ncbi:glycosyltransferase family 4 protein [Aliarcobacter cryaerophilus]|uniref:MraY family glycosyltransferase n=1 Tax=Aliarcobacter cryaerophilus TaxID=28198 RepID=UPI0021B4EE79|nr:glycosyltransferase family 4 protein [Aliarcobacter cryaerophilus]MCT7487097.1 glycosyltransferase family 4 protein [Aliarcobacter cryaerophilus]MCT7491589.1 glycosyltransferase family 4 protein [Aliarcobacter cryaerophilus]